jgi:hypothetical protein
MISYYPEDIKDILPSARGKSAARRRVELAGGDLACPAYSAFFPSTDFPPPSRGVGDPPGQPLALSPDLNTAAAYFGPLDLRR